jgi:hypothetical protein
MMSTSLPFLARVLCRFRGVEPQHLAKHPRETSYLTTHGLALAVPVTMAAVNGWLIGREGGHDVLAALGVAAILALTIYALERVLLALIGTGQTFRLGLALRCVVAACLSFLLGEAVTTRFAFPDSVAAYYQEQADKELTLARGQRDAAIKEVHANRANDTSYLMATVDQRKTEQERAAKELEQARNEEGHWKEVLLAEEEGRAASGLQKRGNRYNEKKSSYLDPALDRVKKAEAALKEADDKLQSASANLTAAVNDTSVIRDSERMVDQEYRRRVDLISGLRHKDLGSRIKAMVEITRREPIVGFAWIICMIFLISVDLSAVLLKSYGRLGGYDIEERQEHAHRMARLRAVESKAVEQEMLIAEVENQSACRSTIVSTSLLESLAMIRQIRTYQQEVSILRQPVVEDHEQAEAAGLSDLAAFCRKSLDVIDDWANAGLSKTATALKQADSQSAA